MFIKPSPNGVEETFLDGVRERNKGKSEEDVEKSSESNDEFVKCIHSSFKLVFSVRRRSTKKYMCCKWCFIFYKQMVCHIPTKYC